jgi:hypothetical protein
MRYDKNERDKNKIDDKAKCIELEKQISDLYHQLESQQQDTATQAMLRARAEK